ncbi:sigma-54-dependent Fis family transcriptional regulator [Thioalkalivibrio sp. ALM2T]|uniref:sigma-54 interaction domain-containing protein n=1 Tax=Thioalkalivibrio sp. ALM2T TaxID=1158184 RepID=UPI00036B1E0D|nr:sigma-54-dependent Fis family transcriptional regulator [Thioalkalivibrio sp. ALM2T]
MPLNITRLNVSIGQRDGISSTVGYAFQDPLVRVDVTSSPKKELQRDDTEIDTFRQMLEAFREPAILLAPDYRILAANSAYQRVYDTDDRGSGRTCFEASHGFRRPCDEAGEACPLRAALGSGRRERVLHVHHTATGREHVDVELTPIRGEGGEVRYLLERLHHLPVATPQAGASGLVGRSQAFNSMLGLISRVAPSNASALLLGESGTGKELVARAIHEESPRSQSPFVPVECSGLTETLFESELFGHEKGAFTGATTAKAGLVEAAEGGTLFLDEVGDIPLSQQVKLLRLLETHAYRRVGGVESRRADFRLVCATHRDLEAMVRAGEFREDLYYRINTFPINVPPLRERAEDIPLLVDALIERLELPVPPRLDAAALKLLKRYPFPGNVRELRNLLERAALLADGEAICPEHLPAWVEERASAASRQDNGGLHGLLHPQNLRPLEDVEREYLRHAAAVYPGDRRTLARELGISERSLYRRLRQLEGGADEPEA